MGKLDWILGLYFGAYAYLLITDGVRRRREIRTSIANERDRLKWN